MCNVIHKNNLFNSKKKISSFKVIKLNKFKFKEYEIFLISQTFPNTGFESKNI